MTGRFVSHLLVESYYMVDKSTDDTNDVMVAQFV